MSNLSAQNQSGVDLKQHHLGYIKGLGMDAASHYLCLFNQPDSTFHGHANRHTTVPVNQKESKSCKRIAPLKLYGCCLCLSPFHRTESCQRGCPGASCQQLNFPWGIMYVFVLSQYFWKCEKPWFFFFAVQSFQGTVYSKTLVSPGLRLFALALLPLCFAQ